ncbi:hypothetical protein Pd630_LPD04725 [Rhodococcus opacus PD630]|nr:hypothetical protein Pd630_LPD04725 [Rhodococcus opacus PD630]
MSFPDGSMRAGMVLRMCCVKSQQNDGVRQAQDARSPRS